MSPDQPTNKIGKSVGERLRAARVARHYTQGQLALPDFSVSYISAIERGQIHPSLRALEILAARLGLASTQLLPNREQGEEPVSVVETLIERDEDEIELTLLGVHILILQGDVEKARRQLGTVSNRRLPRNYQLQQLYLQGWIYYVMGQYQESAVLLAEAAQIAKEINATYTYLRSLNLLGESYAAVHNYIQALQVQQRCLHALEGEDSDLFFILEVSIHIGQQYMRLKNFVQALETFTAALEIADQLSNAKSIQEVYAKQSKRFLAENEYNLATLYAYKSAQLHDQERMTRLRSELYHYLGRALLQSDQEKAWEMIEEALKQPEIRQDHLTIASLMTSRAQWYLQHEEVEEAEKSIKQAQELAQPFGDTIIAAEILITQGDIEYRQKRYAEGDQHFVAGLDMFEALSKHEELANESVHYAQLLEEIGRERDAFTYFRRAFQSRQKLGK